jgi:hypothetical protein
VLVPISVPVVSMPSLVIVIVLVIALSQSTLIPVSLL